MPACMPGNQNLIIMVDAEAMKAPDTFLCLLPSQNAKLPIHIITVTKNNQQQFQVSGCERLTDQHPPPQPQTPPRRRRSQGVWQNKADH